MISTFTNNFASADAIVAPPPTIVAPPPIYRFVPEVGFTNYNRVSYQPPVEVEVPSVVVPSNTYGLPPVTPARTYGLPN